MPALLRPYFQQADGSGLVHRGRFRLSAVRRDQPAILSTTAAHKLIEIASGVEAVQDGRIHIEKINQAFLDAGGTPSSTVSR